MLTLECLWLINKTAFRELSLKECDYLLGHAAGQLQYGLNVKPTVRESWEYVDITQDDKLELEALFLNPTEIKTEDVKSIRAKFKESGLSRIEIRRHVQDFIYRCRREKIGVPELL